MMWRVVKIIIWIELAEAVVGLTVGFTAPWLIHYSIIPNYFHFLPDRLVLQ